MDFVSLVILSPIDANLGWLALIRRRNIINSRVVLSYIFIWKIPTTFLWQTDNLSKCKKYHTIEHFVSWLNKKMETEGNNLKGNWIQNLLVIVCDINFYFLDKKKRVRSNPVKKWSPAEENALVHFLLENKHFEVGFILFIATFNVHADVC